MEPDEPIITPEEETPSVSYQEPPAENFELPADFIEALSGAQTSADLVWADPPAEQESAAELAGNPFDDLDASTSFSEASPSQGSEAAESDSSSALDTEASDTWQSEEVATEAHFNRTETPSDVETRSVVDSESIALPPDASDYPEGHFFAEQAAARGLQRPGQPELAADVVWADTPSEQQATPGLSGTPFDDLDAPASFSEASPSQGSEATEGDSFSALDTEASDTWQPEEVATEAHFDRTETPSDVEARSIVDSESIALPPDASEYPEGHFFAEQAAARGLDRPSRPAPAEDVAATSSDPNAPLSYEQELEEMDRVERESPTPGSGLDVPVPDSEFKPQEMTYEEALAEIDRFERSLPPAAWEPDTGNSFPQESGPRGYPDPAATADAGEITGATDLESSREFSETTADDAPPQEEQTSVDPDEKPEPDDAPMAEPLSSPELAALLNDKADHAGEPLAWKTSVMDLLKLLGQDSSREARRELAVELGLQGMEGADTGSADFNERLHRHILSTLARHGGNWPTNLS